MDESSRVLLSTLIGATLGGVAGYLYLTEHGRRVRGQIEPTLDAISIELQRARKTGAKLRKVAREGERTFRSLVNEEKDGVAWHSADMGNAES